MQGPKLDRFHKIRIVAALAVAFVAGALAIFAAVAALGSGLGVAGLPLRERLVLGGAGVLALAALDVASVRASRYCPLGWRRQTPKILMRRFSPAVTAGLWGFDTGLAVTTFRVTALTWGALLLVGLGFAPWWVGACYGAAFALPLAALLLWHRAGWSAWEAGPADAGLESLLARRPAAQAASALLLLTSGAVLLAGLRG